MGNMLANPFSGAQSNGPAAGSNANQTQAPQNSSPNSGMNNNGNTGDSFMNPNGNGNNNNNNNNNANPPANGDNSGVAKDPLLDLWNPTAVDPNAPKAADPNAPYLPTVKPEDLTARFNQMDFTKNIKPETLDIMAKGGADGVRAMMGVINDLGRNLMSQSWKMSTNMTEAGLKNAKGRFLGEVPNITRDQLSYTELNSQADNIINDPQFAPIVNATRQQILQKFPKATVPEVNKMLNDYYTAMATKLSGKGGAGKDGSGAAPTNNDLLANGDPNADWASWVE